MKTTSLSEQDDDTKVSNTDDTLNCNSVPQTGLKGGAIAADFRMGDFSNLISTPLTWTLMLSV
jgi:hypothetical protein